MPLPLPPFRSPISPARRCWSPAPRPASARHSPAPMPSRAARSACTTTRAAKPPRTLAAEIAEERRRGVPRRKATSRVSADVARVVEDTARHFGRLDGLVNNAGGMLGRVPYSEMTDEQYDRVMDLNARSVITACRVAMPWLKKHGGFIVNTSSVAARNGAGGGAGLYGSAKSFVSNVTRGLAKELIGDRIRVNAVAPGVIATPFHERYSSAEQMKGMIATIPQGRAGTAEDCVGAYLFLSSDLLSGYITGQVIEVNGGQLMP